MFIKNNPKPVHTTSKYRQKMYVKNGANMCNVISLIIYMGRYIGEKIV